MTHATAAQLIAFEEKVRLLWEAGELPSLLHLCGGNEPQLIAIFERIKPGDWIFSTHRAHYHALLAGLSPEFIEQEIRRDRSMFLFSREHRFFTSAVLAGCCGLAAGVARAIRDAGGSETVWCFLGDGAEDQGHFAEAVHYVAGHRLPCRFIIEDNNQQVDTSKAERRGGPMRYVLPLEQDHGVLGLARHSPDILWPDCVERYHYTARWPHAGSGCQHQIVFKRTSSTDILSVGPAGILPAVPAGRPPAPPPLAP